LATEGPTGRAVSKGPARTKGTVLLPSGQDGCAAGKSSNKAEGVLRSECDSAGLLATGTR
jgi:hypothetical protein